MHAAAAGLILRDQVELQLDRHALRAPAGLAPHRLQSLHDAIVLPVVRVCMCPGQSLVARKNDLDAHVGQGVLDFISAAVELQELLISRILEGEHFAQ